MVQTVKVTDQRELVNVLYYGDGGTGKTTALASMANLGRVFYVDAEAGVKRRPLEDLGVNVANIELFDVDRISFSKLEDAHEQLLSELTDDPDSWAGVVWDSGTEIYQAFLEHAVDRRVEKALRVERSGRSVSELMTDRFFTDRDDYGYMSSQIRNLLRRFRDLPCHFGTAFLERRDQDAKTGEVRIGPSISPALQSDVVGWHDIVCRTTYDAGADVWLGTFRPEGVRQGKDRYGAMPPKLVDPSFERLVGYITGEIEPDQDPRQTAWADAMRGEGEDDKPKAKVTSKELVAQRRAKRAQGE